MILEPPQRQKRPVLASRRRSCSFQILLFLLLASLQFLVGKQAWQPRPAVLLPGRRTTFGIETSERRRALELSSQRERRCSSCHWRRRRREGWIRKAATMSFGGPLLEPKARRRYRQQRLLPKRPSQGEGWVQLRQLIAGYAAGDSHHRYHRTARTLELGVRDSSRVQPQQLSPQFVLVEAWSLAIVCGGEHEDSTES